jgi:hypothetical protein
MVSAASRLLKFHFETLDSPNKSDLNLQTDNLPLQFQVCICHARAVSRRSMAHTPAQFENLSRMPRHCPDNNLKARSDHEIHVLALSPVTNQKPSSSSLLVRACVSGCTTGGDY